jgi:hypothetical protein
MYLDKFTNFIVLVQRRAQATNRFQRADMPHLVFKWLRVGELQSDNSGDFAYVCSGTASDLPNKMVTGARDNTLHVFKWRRMQALCISHA